MLYVEELTPEQMKSVLKSLDLVTIQSEMSERLVQEAESGNKGKAFAVAKSLEKDILRQLGAMSTRERLSKDFSLTAFGIQIEQACRPSESIKQSAVIHNMDYDELKAAQMHNDKWYYQDTVLRKYDDYFTIEGNGIYPKSELKRDVKASTTLNRGLGAVHVFQTIDQKIQALQESDDKKTEQISDLSAQALIQRMDIEHIKEVSGWGADPKLKAKGLRDAGYTYKDIGKHLGVTDRTVKRWLKQMSPFCPHEIPFSA
jgi:hypothetical protein